ncbi:RNA methyltransferase [Azonexus sp.]|uniref:RNA methyltransferase n=1 Tax=Azonexus sp. TaxID=1872668 RepID=UPI0039E6481E
MKPDALLSRIRVVLCRPSHPGNIGAAARAMKTMGLHDLCLVRPQRFPDSEASTRATGAVDVLEKALVVDSLAQALEACVFSLALSARQRDLGPRLGTPRTGVEALLRYATHGPVALVFGNESSGLANEEIMQCQATVTIPTNPQFSSLNLGAAVQLLCYECRMSAFAGAAPLPAAGVTPLDGVPATHAEIEGLYSHLTQIMQDTGFYNPQQPGRLLAKLRRLFGRAALEREEINILRGILSATQQPTRHGRQAD